MARAYDLGRKRSGLSYADAARKFGVTIDEVRAYAQMAKDFNRQQKAVAKEYGYKGELKLMFSLGGLAKDIQAINRFGGARNLFQYMQEEVRARLQDVPRLEFEQKAEQYHANMIQALSNNVNAAFEESDVSKAIKQLQTMTPKEVMKFTHGEFFESYYGSTERAANQPDAEDMILALAEKWDGEA